MKKIVRVLITSLVTNTFLVVSKIVFGVIGKSQALIADGFHSLSDLTTDIVGITGIKKSFLPADEKHPYGHGRIEYVTSIIIGSIIFILGVFLLIDIFTTPTQIPENTVVIVIIMTIILKYLLARYVVKSGNKYKNAVLIASGKESTMDVMTSGMVLLTFILSRFSSNIELLKHADKLGGFLIGIFIIKVSIEIILENGRNVLGQVETDPKVLSLVEKYILSVKGVKTIDTLDMLKCGSYYQVILNIGINEDEKLIESHNIAHKVESILKKKIGKIKYVIIHVNPFKKED
ncbi:MAG: cation diffusion facilitator family transporter [Bacilli bacterium]